jgi:hypothetical protein
MLNLESRDRASLAAVAIAVVAALALALPAFSQASLRILAPASVEASQAVPFAAAPSGEPEKVTFYVDGRRRWTDDSPSWKCGRDGRVRLSQGRHLLKVRAKQGNRAVITERAIYVEPVPTAEATSAPTAPVRSAPVRAPKPAPIPVPDPEAPAEPTPAPETTPSPTPTPAPSPAPGSGKAGLLWSGSKISDFVNQSAPGAVTEVPDPAGSGETVMKMTVNNSDVAPITPTDNPRAQLGSPEFVHPGDEMWWHARFYLPKDFPAFVPGWMNVMEGPYGAPWAGSPPIEVEVHDDAIRWQRNNTYSADIPWSIPIIRGQWVDVLEHFRFGHDGFVETWIDGEQITFFKPGSYNPLHEPETTHLNMQTMDSSNDGGTNFFVLQSYRMKNMFGSLSIYQGATEVGTTRESVEA